MKVMTKTGPLTGKTALITGADTGIGKSIAKALAGQGAQVVIQHPHSPESAADVVKEITGADGSASALAADLGDRAEYEELVQALLDEFGHWDVLVNNAAAIATPLPDITGEEFDSGFAAQAKAVFHGMQLAWHHLADGGRIITVAGATTPSPGSAVADATAGAIAEFTRALAADFAPRRIAVTAVSPGTAEPNGRGQANSGQGPSYETGTSGLDRLDEATEITDVVAFLASDEADELTARHIRFRAPTD